MKGVVLLGIHDTVVRDALAMAGGREVKHTGDSIMASFISAAAAIRCASQIQRTLPEYQQRHAGYPLKVRIGATAGELVEREYDLFGAVVQLAARLCSLAHPEQIVVSNVVAELCLKKGFNLQRHGRSFRKSFRSSDPGSRFRMVGLGVKYRFPNDPQ